MINKWKNNREAFEVLTKDEFDKLYREGRFVNGPKVEEPSSWMKEFGPYNPHRWAFGQLDDDRYVRCDVT